MKLKLTVRITTVVFSIFLIGVHHGVLAQPYPYRPIRLIVGNQVGAGMDVTARAVSAKLGGNLGATIVVDNRPGAAGIIAAELLAKAPPDGYTLLLVNNAIAILPLLYEKLPFDTRKDFAAVTLVATSANILVAHAGLPANSVSDVIALAKSKPGEITLGALPRGSFSGLCGMLFEKLAGIRLSHIQYRGGPAALTDLLAGRIALQFTGIPVVHSFIKEAKLKGLAVTTMTRSPLVPDVPTLHEAGVPGYDAPLWYGVLAPAGTPASVLDKVQVETANALTDSEVRKLLVRQGLEAAASSPKAFAERIETERSKWAQILVEK